MRLPPVLPLGIPVLALFLSACGSGGSSGSTPTTPTTPTQPPTGTPPTGTPPTGTPAPAGAFASTYFVDGSRTLTGQGSWRIHPFTLGGTRTLVFRIAAQYSIQAAIIADSQVTAFTNGAGFSGWAIFDSEDGFATVTLAAGNYNVAIRNASSGSNTVRYELDYAQNLSSGTFTGSTNSTATSLNPGQRRWDPLTIQSGRRYWIDGCNSGLDAFVIDAAQLPNFQAGGSFMHYSDYGAANSPDVYGGIELNLAPGSYYLVQRNPTSSPQSVNYLVQSWSAASTAILESEVAAAPCPSVHLPGLDAAPSSSLPRRHVFAGSACGAPSGTFSLGISSRQDSLVIDLTSATPERPAILVAGLEAQPRILEASLGCELIPRTDFMLPCVTNGCGAASIAIPTQALLVLDSPGLIFQWVLPIGSDSSPLVFSEAGHQP